MTGERRSPLASTVLPLLLLLLLAVTASSVSAAQVQQESNNSTKAVPELVIDTTQPLVCIVIRTYWAHGKHGDNNLAKILKEFQSQAHTNWVVQLIVMDNRAFPDLRYLIRDLKDERIWVYAEWVSYKYAPRTENKQWTPGYHGKLYNLTDDAIRACPPETRWVLVTNGDNHYDTRLFEELPAAESADIVAFDYYTRYQRSTGPPCMRFAAGADLAPCKENGVRWCHTDLSANMYSFRRMVAENKRFGLADPMGISADGMLMTDLVNSGWKVHHVRGKCLVEHAPAPQMCARQGRVWDDSRAASQDTTGGACIDKEAAEQLVAADASLELLTLNVTHDGKSFNFTDAPLELGCIRAKDPQRWDLLRFFGPACSSRFDSVGWTPT